MWFTIFSDTNLLFTYIYMKTLKYLLSLGLLTFCFSASAAEIDTITAIDNKTIQVTTSSDIFLSTEVVEAEVKVLQDTPVEFVGVSLDNPQKLILDLGEPLTTGTSYNLIGIVGVDTLIDFTTAEVISEPVIATYEESIGEQSITEVIVKDNKSLELIFSQPLTESEFEFKILNEVAISPVTASTENMFQVPVITGLLANTNYIMMVLALKDNTGTPVTLTEELNDFSTPVDLVIQPEEELTPEELPPVSEEESELPPVINENEENNEMEVPLENLENTEDGTTSVPALPELNAAGDEAEGNLAEVSSNAEITPETGTATNVLLLLSVMLT
jgi:hypothetical protein